MPDLTSLRNQQARCYMPSIITHQQFNIEIIQQKTECKRDTTQQLWQQSCQKDGGDIEKNEMTELVEKKKKSNDG